MVVAAGTPSTVMVNAIGKNWNGKVTKTAIKVKLDAGAAKANQTVYLILDKKDDKGIWTVKALKAD